MLVTVKIKFFYFSKNDQLGKQTMQNVNALNFYKIIQENICNLESIHGVTDFDIRYYKDQNVCDTQSLPLMFGGNGCRYVPWQESASFVRTN